MRKMLYRARRKGGDVREIEAAIERINYELNRKGAREPMRPIAQP